MLRSSHMAEQPKPEYEYVPGRTVLFGLGELRAHIQTSGSMNGEIVEKFDVTNSKEETSSLLRFVPSGWKIKLCTHVPRSLEEQGYAHLSSQLLLLPRERSVGNEKIFYFENDIEAVLSLFHEAGHAKYPSIPNLPEGYEERMRYLSDLYKNPQRMAALREFLQKNTVANERRAWMYALRVLRVMRDEGYALAPAKILTAETRKVLEKCLGPYQDPRKMPKRTAG